MSDRFVSCKSVAQHPIDARMNVSPAELTDRLPAPSTDDRALWDIWLASYQLPILTVADEIGLFSALEGEWLEANELAAKLQLDARAVAILMNALGSLNLVSKHDDKFSLTPLSRNYLLPDSPCYWGGVLRMFRDTSSALTSSLLVARLRATNGRRTGRGASSEVMKQWESGAISPDLAKRTTENMHSHSLSAAIGLARDASFADVARLLDVGGGSGCFSIELARANPRLRCTVLDLPTVCPLAREYIAHAGLTDRIETFQADMFHNDWPSGHDAVLFSNVLHDWDYDRCNELVRRSFEALPQEGRILIHEMLLSDTGDAPTTTALFSALMLVATRGRQFTSSEIIGILRRRGFRDIFVTPTHGYYSLVTGRKP
jgi:acetylserotonin N-methyltransferase